MNQLDDIFKEVITEAEQRKNRRKMKEQREQDAKRKIDIHRNIVIGELVCQYFPDMMQLQPRWNKADNKAEFAEFENVLKWLASHAELLENIRDNPKNES